MAAPGAATTHRRIVPLPALVTDARPGIAPDRSGRALRPSSRIALHGAHSCARSRAFAPVPPSRRTARPWHAAIWTAYPATTASAGVTTLRRFLRLDSFSPLTPLPRKGTARRGEARRKLKQGLPMRMDTSFWHGNDCIAVSTSRLNYVSHPVAVTTRSAPEPTARTPPAPPGAPHTPPQAERTGHPPAAPATLPFRPPPHGARPCPDRHAS